MSDRSGIRAALKAYVQGHDRVWTTGRKLGRRPAEAPPPPEFGHLPQPPTFGVDVPDRLAFGRGPGTSRAPRGRPGEG